MPPSCCPVTGQSLRCRPGTARRELWAGLCSSFECGWVPTAHKRSPYGHLLLLMKTCCAGREWAALIGIINELSLKPGSVFLLKSVLDSLFSLKCKILPCKGTRSVVGREVHVYTSKETFLFLPWKNICCKYFSPVSSSLEAVVSWNLMFQKPPGRMRAGKEILFYCIFSL